MVLTRNAEATQQRLMHVALELYAERGYAGTCLDAILQRAQSSKGAFYHHFASKEELTARALTLYWDRLLHDLKAQWQQGSTPQARIDALLAFHEPCDEERLGCPIGLLGFEARSLPELVQQALREGLERWLELVTGMLLEAGLEDVKEARCLAERLFLVYEGGVLMERISGSCCTLRSALTAWHMRVLELLPPE
jgi:AcrR family transcriptional regulator